MSKISTKDLKHLPKSKGLPLLGDFLKVGKMGSAYFQENQEKHGNIFSFNVPTGTILAVLGEDNNKYILKTLGAKATTKGGFEDIIGELYPNCLLQMDGPVHKKHRGIIQKAFTLKALEDYMEQMPPIIQQTIDDFKQGGRVEVYPHFKMLTLRIAAKIFFGITDPDLVQKIMDAVSPMTRAQFTIQVNFPGTLWNKAMKGRRFLLKTFLDLVPERRVNPGKDLFSKMCHAKSDEGEVFTDQEIVDHMIFMVQASHDTTAWTMTSVAYELAKHPEWQERVREESKGLELDKDLKFRSLMELKALTLVFKESMRISPSTSAILREADEDLEIEGKQIPKGTKMWISLSLPQKDSKHWTNPEVFDPERFNEERNEYKGCPHAYMPFGAGAHLCLGNIFAEMSVKMMTVALLQHFKVSAPEDYTQQMQEVPMTYPRDGMPLLLEPVKP